MKRIGQSNIIRELCDAIDRRDDATVIRILQMAITPQEAKRIMDGVDRPAAAADKD